MAYPRSSVDWAEGAHLGAQVGDVVARAVRLPLDAAMGTGAQGPDDLALAPHERALVAQHRPAASLHEPTPFVVEACRQRAASALAGGGHRGTLGDGIRHDRLGCVGGVEARWSATRSSRVSTS